jgi:uncharacterized membrane protein
VNRPRPADAGLHDLERVLATVLRIGTYAAVACLAAGAVLLIAAGRSPLEAGPQLDLARLVGDLVALRPEGLLWIGLIAVIATPATRVAASLVGYTLNGERPMALVSLAILGVIVAGIVLGIRAEA